MPEEQAEPKPAEEQGEQPPESNAAPRSRGPEEPPPPRMGAPIAAAVVGGGIALIILVLYLIARSQAHGILDDMYEDQPLELKQVDRGTEAGLIRMQREALTLAAQEQRPIEITPDMAVLLLAGNVFDLPAEPQKVGVEVKPIPDSRVQIGLSVPLGKPPEKYLNIQAVLRFSNPDPEARKQEERTLRYHYESLKIGKIDLVDKLLLEAKGPVSRPLAVFDNWLDPPPNRITVEEDRLILDYVPLKAEAEQE